MLIGANAGAQTPTLFINTQSQIVEGDDAEVQGLPDGRGSNRGRDGQRPGYRDRRHDRGNPSGYVRAKRRPGGSAAWYSRVPTDNDLVDEDASTITMTLLPGNGLHGYYRAAWATGARFVSKTTTWAVLLLHRPPPPQLPDGNDCGVIGDGVSSKETMLTFVVTPGTNSMGALTVDVTVSEDGMMISGTAPTMVMFRRRRHDGHPNRRKRTTTWWVEPASTITATLIGEH